jgi:ribosomal protein L37E
MDEEETTEIKKSEPVCPRCGLRSYDSECANCGTPIVDKKDDEDEEYDWREKKR